MKKGTSFTWALLAIGLLAGCDDHPQEPTVKYTQVSGSGDISGKLTEFRALLGDPLNATPNQTSGRREINWDGVPANLTNVDTFPGDFFNNTDPAGPNGRKRGAVFTTPGTGFRLSDNDYSDLLADYGNQFNTFSLPRLFVPMGSTLTESTFRVAGTNTEATVKGFGVIFSDVDDANSTTVEFYEGTKSLGVFKAPVRSDDAGFSFLGVFFPDNKVTKVIIKTGNASLSTRFPDGAQYDLVAMDDFFYDEPKAK